tara:strand:- start:920 stop:1510 length:591 start_codon:yes stop_codon:yes gene_type:complete
MPIIKDKYGAKGENTRSKYVTRKNNTVIDSPSSGMSTFQKKELEADNIRSAGAQQSLYGSQSNIITSEKIGLISGFRMGSVSGLVNTLENVITLNVGESLKSINISHHHGSGTSTVFSLYWSAFPLQEIAYTTGTGFLSSITRGTLYRIMSDTLVSSSTLTLNDNNVLNGFNNINKTIYIYAISSVRGTELTILKC